MTTTTTTNKNSTTIIITPTNLVKKLTNNSPKFLMATSTDPNKSLLKLNPFQLANVIDTVTGSNRKA